MKSNKLFAATGKALPAVTATLIVVVLMSQAASAQTSQWKNADYDAVRDFSIQSNPGGVWSYGWTSSLGSPLNLYTVTDTTSVPGMSAWLASGTYWANPPYVAHNDTGKEVCPPKLNWCFPPAYLHLHPGQKGQLSVVRWTAPSSGKFLIEGAFEGLDRGGPTTTDVHVLVNSTKSRLSGPIANYRWPLTFQVTATVLIGDTIDFAVGFGKDGNWNGDSTGVRFTVTRQGKD